MCSKKNFIITLQNHNYAANEGNVTSLIFSSHPYLALFLGKAESLNWHTPGCCSALSVGRKQLNY